MCDRNHKKITELLYKPGNKICADCGSEDPEYASYNLGVFVCTTCAAVHQKIGTHISKVKSLKLAKWNDDQVQALESLGNTVVNCKYEKHVPVFYRRPMRDSPTILLEQWIRAKYERLEFMHVDKQKYNRGSMEDILLLKKRKDDSTFSPKLFILSEENSNLAIAKEDSKEVKVIISLARLNLSLSPTKLNNENSMQLTFIEDGITKHIFVAHEKAETLIDWYMGIRHCKLIAFMRAYPSASKSELLPYLTKDFTLEGWVWKTGPNDNDAYRKRWLTLDGRKLMYHMHPLDDCPRGEIFVGSRSENFGVSKGASSVTKESGHAFSLVTPERTFVFSVTSSAEREEWLAAIGALLDRPLSAHDIQVRVSLDPTKKRTSRHSWFHF